MRITRSQKKTSRHTNRKRTSKQANLGGGPETPVNISNGSGGFTAIADGADGEAGTASEMASGSQRALRSNKKRKLN